MKNIKIQVEGYKCEGCGKTSQYRKEILLCENGHQCKSAGHEGRIFSVDTDPLGDGYSTLFEIQIRCSKKSCEALLETKRFDFNEMPQDVLEKLYNELPEKDL